MGHNLRLGEKTYPYNPIYLSIFSINHPFFWGTVPHFDPFPSVESTYEAVLNGRIPSHVHIKHPLEIMVGDETSLGR